MPQTITCECKKRLRVHDHLVGKKIKCPGCGRVHVVRGSEPAKPPSDASYEVVDDAAPRPSAQCPSCASDLQPSAVICVRCGYDLSTGQKVTEADAEIVRGGDQAVGYVIHRTRLLTLALLCLPLAIAGIPILLMKLNVIPHGDEGTGPPPAVWFVIIGLGVMALVFGPIFLVMSLRVPRAMITSPDEAIDVLSLPAKWMWWGGIIVFGFALAGAAMALLTLDIRRIGAMFFASVLSGLVWSGAKRMGNVQGYLTSLAACAVSFALCGFIWLAVPACFAFIRLLRRDVRQQFDGWF